MNLMKMTQAEAATFILEGKEEITLRGQTTSGDAPYFTLNFEDLMACDFSVAYDDNASFVCEADYYAIYTFKDGNESISRSVIYHGPNAGKMEHQLNINLI